MISTTFTIRISQYPNSGAGDGMTFIFAPDTNPSPLDSDGSFLGIMSRSPHVGSVSQLALELDTFMNEFDPDANHIGIDATNMSKPITVTSLNGTGIDLKSGRNIKVQIDYDGRTKMLYVSMAYSEYPLGRILEKPIIMSDVVPSSVYVGFTAATGDFSESHQFLLYASSGLLFYHKKAMFFLLLFSSFLNQASLSSIIQPVSVPITFNNFNPDSCNNGNDLICMGSVTAGNGYLSLTPEPYSTLPPPLNKVGRVLFHQPVLAWPAMFTTTFTVRISKFPDATGSGDGMAFVMAQDNKPPPPNGYGSYLGIMDKSTQDGVVRQLAVELDTYMNEYMIPDGNHIGVDTTSMATPVAAKSLNSTGIDLKSGRNITVKIDYDGAK
ncbi:hypothetical protein WN943_000321 [Citrus x changshan-huyou]